MTWIAVILLIFPGIMIFTYIGCYWTIPHKLPLMVVGLAFLLLCLGTSIYFTLAGAA